MAFLLQFLFFLFIFKFFGLIVALLLLIIVFPLICWLWLKKRIDPASFSDNESERHHHENTSSYREKKTKGRVIEGEYYKHRD